MGECGAPARAGGALVAPLERRCTYTLQRDFVACVGIQAPAGPASRVDAQEVRLAPKQEGRRPRQCLGK